MHKIVYPFFRNVLSSIGVPGIATERGYLLNIGLLSVTISAFVLKWGIIPFFDFTLELWHLTATSVFLYLLFNLGLRKEKMRKQDQYEPKMRHYVLFFFLQIILLVIFYLSLIGS